MDVESPVLFSDVLAARERLGPAILCSPCVESAALSELTGARVFCKQEHLQRTGSFKERGARNALLQLEPGQARAGVIAASAGNHALGLAWHGQLLNIPVTVVMPRFAPLTKVSRCRRFGATVVLHGDTFDECRGEAARLAEERGLTYVHPFDDPHVIAGQGTVALEVFEQVPGVEAIVVPVGGGGLLAGVSVATRGARPGVEVIGVEPAHAACFTAAMSAGKPTRIPVRATLADGLAVLEAGATTHAVACSTRPRLVTVSEESLALSMLRIAEHERSIVEGAGAAGLAALLGGNLPELRGRCVVLILSGGNIDPLSHSRVLERGLVADGRIYRFDALINDRPGGLVHLSTVLAAAGANVTEIVHNRTFAGPDMSRVHVLCTLETRDRAHIAEVQALLAEAGVELRNG